jgi:hypothetical protein
MKDQYSGDVGDFGKFGLLRALTGAADGASDLRLGVVWYLTPDDVGADGRHTGYLDESKEREYRSSDPFVYDFLRTVVREDRRSVARLHHVLPQGTLVYSVSFAGIPLSQRVAVRERWLSAAHEKMSAAQLVFVDPDNGLAPESWRPRRKDAPKHAVLSEVVSLIGHDRSVVIYHHMSRQGSHPEQINYWLSRIASETSTAPFALRFRRGSGRAFFIVPAAAHAEQLRSRADAVLAGEWGKRDHFDPQLYDLEVGK